MKWLHTTSRGIDGLALLCSLAVPAYALNVPTTTQTFAQYIAAVNPTVQSWYLFGSAVSPGAGQTGITNETQLAAAFNPCEDFAGCTYVSSVMSATQQFTNGSNFVFDTGDLALTATLQSGTVNPITNGVGTSTALTTGTPQTLSSFCTGCSSTNLFVGELFSITYTSGAYYISALSGSLVTAQPLMGAPTTSGTGTNPINFTPWAAATTTGPGSGNCYNFAAAPSSVANGQAVQVLPFSGGQLAATPASITPVYVSSFTSTQVCTGAALPAQASGAVFLFLPAINAAEVWDKNTYTPPTDGGGMLAVEWTVTFQNSLGATKYPSTVASIPTNAPWGQWPTLWGYPSNGGYPDYGSEPDAIELNQSADQDGKTWTGNNHGAAAGAGVPRFYNSSLGAWNPCQSSDPGCSGNSDPGTSTPFQYLFSTTDYTLAQHKVELVLTGGRAYRYMDGVLVREDAWQWGDQNPMHVAAQLAIGNLTQFGALFYPLFNGEFPITEKLAALEIWARP